MPEHRERRLDRLFTEAGAAAPTACPDPELLAAVAEGSADDVERDLVLAHVPCCDACLQALRLVAADAVPGTSRGRRLVFPVPLRVVVAAAAVLAVVGAWLWLDHTDRRDGDSGTLLAQVAERMAREEPDLFRDVRPLGPQELASRDADPVRGADVALGPAGDVLLGTPTFTWESVPGAEGYRVRLLDEKGVRWEVETRATTLVWPAAETPLEPGGRYVWTLEAEGDASLDGRQSFRRVTADEAATWAAMVRAAERRVEAPERDLFLAHAALRRGLDAEASRLAGRYLEARPGDPLGAATLARAEAGRDGRR